MTVEPVVSRCEGGVLSDTGVSHLVLGEDLSHLLDSNKDVRLEADKLLDPPMTGMELPSAPQLSLSLHHDIYAAIKNELPSTADIKDKGIGGLNTGSESDMLFGVSSFGLGGPFCAPGGTNNNNEMLNHNHSKNDLGRGLTADRKRPYPCNLCPSRFGSKMELEEHQNSHTGMKPFECDVCKARFNRRSTLWNHKRIHSDAKPFVCTVCQMTFKWKNSLKCHKEMHLRKNESSSVLDNDLRQLTYATAAKKRLLQLMEEGGQMDGLSASASSAAIQSQPLITTSSPKKKKNNTQNNALTTIASLQQQTQAINDQQNKSWLNNGLFSGSDHPLDLDTSSLDTLVQQSNQNLLVHLCSTDMDPSRNGGLLGSMDDSHNMLSNHPLFSDMKPDVNLLHSQDLQFNYSNNLLGSSMAAPSPLNVSLPLNLMNIPRIHGLNSPQQLPSVHHLTSTSLASGVSLPMDYQLGHESISSSVSHPQYIVTTQPDVMLSQSAINYQHPMEPCVVLAGGHEYVNFDYGGMLGHYQLGDIDAMGLTQPTSVDSLMVEDGKGLPFEQW